MSDADYAQVSAQFDEKELAELTFVITVINAWNRLGVAYATDPGSMDKMMGRRSRMRCSLTAQMLR